MSHYWGAFSRAFVPPCNPSRRSPTLGPVIRRLLANRNPSQLLQVVMPLSWPMPRIFLLDRV
ncbi:hypothetical protein F7R01_13830 [Pseudomonas argentinensis]|nr:hypothetical protein F7R01_13830 [Pseudomonas argentinensis]